MLGCGLGLTQLRGFSTHPDSHKDPLGCISLPPTSLPQPEA